MAGAGRSGDQLLTLLAQTTIAGAVTGQTTTPVVPKQGVTTLVLQAKLAYGSGGTTVKAWVQTSFDGGTTWVDVANFAFTTSAATIVHAVKANTTVTANYTPTDGTLADNTIKDGLIGDRLRVKYTTTGTYAGTTHLTITAVAKA